MILAIYLVGLLAALTSAEHVHPEDVELSSQSFSQRTVTKSRRNIELDIDNINPRNETSSLDSSSIILAANEDGYDAVVNNSTVDPTESTVSQDTGAQHSPPRIWSVTETANCDCISTLSLIFTGNSCQNAQIWNTASTSSGITCTDCALVSSTNTSTTTLARDPDHQDHNHRVIVVGSSLSGSDTLVLFNDTIAFGDTLQLPARAVTTCLSTSLWIVIRKAQDSMDLQQLVSIDLSQRVAVGHEIGAIMMSNIICERKDVVSTEINGGIVMDAGTVQSQPHENITAQLVDTDDVVSSRVSLP